MTRLNNATLQGQAPQRVLALLEDAGHQALLVGGPVRNALLGLEVSDFDIATDARPERVMALAEEAGLKAVPTGIDHGTVTLVHDHIPFEVTTFRKDVETDGRRAVVAFADTVEEDARRRDLTMNALYARADGTVIDPLGGLADLTARRVRFIDDPETRIREDYLRILRFFRFTAWYGDPAHGFDSDGLAACAALADGLSQLSRERIGVEIRKLLSAHNPGPAVATMERAGILSRVLSGATARLLPVLIHLEDEAGMPPDPIRRLAALGGEDMAEALRLSRKEARDLELLINTDEHPKPALTLGFRHGLELGRSMVLLHAAALEQPVPHGRLSDVEAGSKAVFPVKAADLPAGLEGPAIGAELKRLEAAWLHSGCALTRKDLLAL